MVTPDEGALARPEEVNRDADKTEKGLYTDRRRRPGHRLRSQSRRPFRGPGSAFAGTALELARGRRCVAELTAAVGSDVSTVSKHLAVLREAGIVEGERSGAQIYYTLRVPCVLNFFGCVEAVMRSKAKEQMRLVGK